ncbi:hypothetical protein GI374_14695 [Paracoccus sp. S-4012]|nr:hypothetical protein [Paracoccus sp. S-4012]
MNAMFQSWQFWPLASATFAALTAVFAKVGVENVGSDFATFIRTGDRIEIDGEAFLIQGEPLRDCERLVWTVDLRPA